MALDYAVPETTTGDIATLGRSTMKGVRPARRLSFGAVVLLLVGLAVAVTPVPANAATTCSWRSGQIGKTSNCDGLYKHQTTCASTAWVVYSRQLRRLGNGPYIDVWVQLWYSNACDTVWAMIPSNGWPADPGQSSGCRAWITRNSDDQWYSEPVDPGIDFAYTKMLYDQTQSGITVTSFAEAECDDGALIYRATTPSW
jgi:hypothetical protein